DSDIGVRPATEEHARGNQVQFAPSLKIAGDPYAAVGGQPLQLRPDAEGSLPAQDPKKNRSQRNDRNHRPIGPQYVLHKRQFPYTLPTRLHHPMPITRQVTSSTSLVTCSFRYRAKKTT